MKGTWRKEKQRKKERKKEGVKESRNFHPTLIIKVSFFDLLENTRLVTINKAYVLLRTQFLRQLWLSTSIAKCIGEGARSSPCSKTHQTKGSVSVSGYSPCSPFQLERRLGDRRRQSVYTSDERKNPYVGNRNMCCVFQIVGFRGVLWRSENFCTSLANFLFHGLEQVAKLATHVFGSCQIDSNV